MTAVDENRKMQKSKRKRFFVFIVMMAVVLAGGMIAIASGKIFSDPVSRIQNCIQNQDYEKAVAVYNRSIAGNVSEEDALNGTISHYIANTVLGWSEEEIDYEQAVHTLQTFKTIDNGMLSSLASENLHTVMIEEEGSNLHEQAEEYYASEHYLKAMQAVARMDEAYSQRKSADELYAQCRDILLESVSNPSTVKEYETSIAKLQQYIEIVEDSGFSNRKKELEEELIVFKAVSQIIDHAQALYDNGSYGSAFEMVSNGLSKYPNDEHLLTELDNLHNEYIIYITEQASEAVSRKEYEAALEIVNKASEEYDCEEFQLLIDSINEEKKFINRIKSSILEKFTAVQQGWEQEKLQVQEDGAGAYVLKSGKKLALGDYTEEDVTVLSFSGNIIAGLANLDFMFDLRDLAYDVQHWGEDEYFVFYLAADAIAVIPVLGALKYLKCADKVVDTGKTTGKLTKALENADTAADAVKEIAKGAGNAAEVADDVSDVIKHADNAADAVKDSIKHYEHIETINQHLMGTVHPKTGVSFEEKYLEYSDGTRKVGVFPVFDSKVDIQLPENLYKAESDEQKEYLLKELKTQISKKFENRKMRKQFSKEELEELAQGVLPEGYVWHHNEKEGLMQLVDEATHKATGHTGGMSLWGKGYE